MSLEDPGHLFLLSLASLSVVVGGCSDGQPGGTPSSVPIPSDDDDNGLYEDAAGEDATNATPCGQYAAISIECYQDAGYGYGGEGAYEVPDQGYLESECNRYLVGAIAVYGANCGAALSELYSCLGSLSCAELLADENGELCLQAYIAVNDECDES